MHALQLVIQTRGQHPFSGGCQILNSLGSVGYGLIRNYSTPLLSQNNKKDEMSTDELGFVQLNSYTNIEIGISDYFPKLWIIILLIPPPSLKL